jgi:4-hydroxyproline epimerase
MERQLERLRVIDSHTGGEPTRIIVEGHPKLAGDSMDSALDEFRQNYDHLRHALVNEPRGSEVIVGAVLCEPVNAGSTAGVFYFNNVGYLGMCVHGTIGLVETLSYLGKIRAGDHRIDTPVGTVTATLSESGEITIANVASRRVGKDITVPVPNYGIVHGDVAWGGNWFFLINEHPFALERRNIEELTEFTWAVREALQENEIEGSDGEEIDHIELFTPSTTDGVDSRNFVLCPGKAYDRSPCGTGTSAKLACLYADGKLGPGVTWRQESIVGSIFEGQIRIEGNQIVPMIKGLAFVSSDSQVIFDPRDSFRYGIP